MIRNVFGKAPIRRALGLFVDFFVLILLWGLPAIWQFFGLQFAQGKLVTQEPNSLLFLPVFSFVTLITPLGFICLRIVCNLIMHMPTPGEYVSGYAVRSQAEYKTVGIFTRQVVVAVGQFFVSWGGVLFAIAFVPSAGGVLEAGALTFLRSLRMPEPLVTVGFIVLFLSLLIVSIVFIFSILFCLLFQANWEEQLLGVKVIKL